MSCWPTSRVPADLFCRMFWQLGGHEEVSNRLGQLNQTQLMLLGAVGAVLCALFFLVAPFLRRYGGNAPYLASSPPAIATILEECAAVVKEKGKGAKMVDMGSGNGELVVEAAKLGLECEVSRTIAFLSPQTQHDHDRAEFLFVFVFCTGLRTQLDSRDRQ